MKNNFLYVLKTFLASLLFMFFAFCGESLSETEIKNNEVKSILERYQKNLKRGGIVVSYQKKGEEIQNVAVGFSDNEKKEPITPEMYFVVASNTKTYVASLVMLLKEQNKLKLSDAISKHIPKVTTDYSAKINSEIKIKELLNHTSGLADYVTPNNLKTMMLNPSKVWTKKEILDIISAPKFTSGTDFAYSNTNYLLLGMIIEKVSEKKYHTFLREQILDKIPLDAFFEGDPKQKSKMPNNYFLTKDQIIPMGDVDRKGFASVSWATGDLVMRPSQMVLFYRALFGGKVVKKASLEEMKKPFSKGEGNTLYGYGLQKRTDKDFTFYGHGGTAIAFRSLTAYEPKTESILCIYVNSSPHEVGFLQKIAKEIFLSIK